MKLFLEKCPTPAPNQMTHWDDFKLILSNGFSSSTSIVRVHPRSNGGGVRVERWEVDSFTARPGWAVWPVPDVYWSWWRRTARTEHCWSGRSRSHLSARRTAWRGTPWFGRCQDRTQPPVGQNIYISMLNIQHLICIIVVSSVNLYCQCTVSWKCSRKSRLFIYLFYFTFI